MCGSHPARLATRYRSSRRKRRSCERSVNAFSLSQGVQQSLSGKARTSRRPCKAAAPKHPHLHQHPHAHTHTYVHPRIFWCFEHEPLFTFSCTYMHSYSYLACTYVLSTFTESPGSSHFFARFVHLMILRRIVFSIPRRFVRKIAEEIGIPRSRSIKQKRFSFFLFLGRVLPADSRNYERGFFYVAS